MVSVYCLSCAIQKKVAWVRQDHKNTELVNVYLTRVVFPFFLYHIELAYPP